ncbi:MAG: amidohydrolase family protein, partial [Candidatus Bathyarchaeia archaeon]
FRKYSYGEDTYTTVLLSAIHQIENGVTCTMHHFYGPVDLLDFSAYQKDVEAGIRANVDSGIRFAFAPHVYDQNACTYMDEKVLPKFPRHLRERFGFTVLNKGDMEKRESLYMKSFDKLYTTYDGHQERVRLYLGPANVHWVSDALWKDIKNLARKLRTGIHTHLVETWYQAEYGQKILGKTPAKHLADLGVLGPEVSCAHSVWLTKEDTKLMAKSRAIAVHNPSSNLRLFSGIAPVLFMKQAGMTVAMGLDGTTINDEEDMFQEMRLAHLLHRVPGVDARHLSSEDLLDMNYSGGAKVTGFAGIGSIEVGKRADMIIVNSERIMAPYFSPKLSFSDLIVLRGLGRDVDHVIINGELLVKDKRFLKADKKKLYAKVVRSWKDTDSQTDKKLAELISFIRKTYKTWAHKEPNYHYNNFS